MGSFAIVNITINGFWISVNSSVQIELAISNYLDKLFGRIQTSKDCFNQKMIRLA